MSAPQGTNLIVTAQAVQLPNPETSVGTTLVVNNDNENSIDLGPISTFTDPIHNFTLDAGQSINWPGGHTLWARITPGQPSQPVAISIWVQPGAISAPPQKVQLQENPTYVIVPDPPAGQDWRYTLSNQGRLIAARAVFTANYTQPGRRNPYLWQVVAGDTQPTEETMLSPYALMEASTSNSAYVLNAVSGLGSQQVRDTPAVPFAYWLPTTSTAIYAAMIYLREAKFFLVNTTAAAVTYAIALQGNDFANGSLPAGESITLDVPDLPSGYEISVVAGASGIWGILSGIENADNRSVIGFEGLLLPPGSSIQSATGNLQSLDQWSDIQLAFTSN